MIQAALSSLWQNFLAAAPGLFLGLLYLGLGWLLGRILGWITTRSLQQLKLDEADSSIGLTGSLRQIGLQQSPARFIGGLIFWAVLLSFLLLALEVSGLQSLFLPVQALLAFLPRLLAAALIVFAGAWLAQLVSRALQAGFERTGLESPQTIAGAVRALTIMLAVILAIDQLGIDTTLLNDTVSSVIAIAVGGAALAFALGSRNITSNILSSFYLHERFQPGDQITLHEREGTLETIGSLHAEISTSEGVWIIPNRDLIEGQVLLRERPAED